jgi:hypothetical protein
MIIVDINAEDSSFEDLPNLIPIEDYDLKRGYRGFKPHLIENLLAFVNWYGCTSIPICYKIQIISFWQLTSIRE